MADEITLKPCPFCGGEPRWWDRKDYKANYTVGCQDIDCFLWIPDDVDVRKLERYATCYRLADDAVKAWNTRHSQLSDTPNVGG